MTVFPHQSVPYGPNFLVAGAAKCGTTSLYDYLRQHPDIFMPPDLKEPHYFCYADRKMDFIGPDGREPFINKSALTTLAPYEDLFAAGANVALRGEASATYLYWPHTAARVAAYAPDMKFIFTLRHPVDRAYSAFNHLKRLSLEPLDFESAVAAEAERTAQNYGFMWRYMAGGRYAHQLQPFLDAFPKEQIHILLFEDLKTDPKAAMQDVLRFLGTDADVTLDLSGTSNESFVPDDKSALHRFIAGENILKTTLRKVLPRNLKTTMAQNVRKAVFNKPQSLSPDLRKQLYQAHFANEHAQLESILGRSLAHWQ